MTLADVAVKSPGDAVAGLFHVTELKQEGAGAAMGHAGGRSTLPAGSGFPLFLWLNTNLFFDS